MITTARSGNPSSASRGAAVTRAKKSLGDAIDKRLDLDQQAMEFSLLAMVIGCPVTEVRQRLDNATLGELNEWIRLIETAPAGGAS